MATVAQADGDPNAGLPHTGLSFDAAYRQVFSSQYVQYATDCVLIGGRWYVDDARTAHSQPGRHDTSAPAKPME